MPKVLLQPTLSTCHGDWHSRFAISLSLFTQSILHHSDFVKSLSTHSQKNFRNILEIVKKAYCGKAVKRMQMRVIIKKAKKEKPAAADHRNFYAKTFITNIAAEADND